jgi:hypothetical protein
VSLRGPTDLVLNQGVFDNMGIVVEGVIDPKLGQGMIRVGLGIDNSLRMLWQDCQVRGPKFGSNLFNMTETIPWEGQPTIVEKKLPPEIGFPI